MIVALTLTWLVYVSLRRDVAGDTARYSAVFTDVYGLREGDDVRMAGVRVGRVEKVELDGKLAKVAFVVQSEQRLFGNTLASVTYQNIVGQRYLGLSLGKEGSPALLPPGSTIPLERTEPSFDVTTLLNGYEPLFSLLNPHDADNLTKGIIQSLQGDTSSLTTLVGQTSTLTQTFAGRDQALGSVITNLDKVVGNLAQQNDNLDGVITQTRSVVGELDRRRPDLVASVGSLARVTEPAVGLGHGRVPGTARIHRSPARCHQTHHGCRTAGGVLRRQHPVATERAYPGGQSGRLRQCLRVRRELHGVLPRPQRRRADHHQRRHAGNRAWHTPRCRSTVDG